jgi:hypothetical protein
MELKFSIFLYKNSLCDQYVKCLGSLLQNVIPVSYVGCVFMVIMVKLFVNNVQF